MHKFLLLPLLLFCTCSNDVPSNGTLPTTTQSNGKTIASRFSPPKGFQRAESPNNSFAAFLRQLPLKPTNSKVYLFNGQLKANQDVHAAVVDLDVGKRDLQQCADAIMRLRAEYLYQEKAFEEISFNFTNGFPAPFSRWSNGEGVQVSGNKCSWVPKPQNNSSYSSFRKYMNLIFSYAGTLSLEKELSSKPVNDIAIGDVFIQGGSPGHAVLVVDMAVQVDTGEKAFLLVQSYMPAQDIHVLINPRSFNGSPWYFLSDVKNELPTPEWKFNAADLRHF